jgi:hypothetical protein
MFQVAIINAAYIKSTSEMFTYDKLMIGNTKAKRCVGLKRQKKNVVYEN